MTDSPSIFDLHIQKKSAPASFARP